MDDIQFQTLNEAIQCSIQKFLIACMDEYSEGIRSGLPREECFQRLNKRIENSVVCEMLDTNCIEQCEAKYQQCLSQGTPQYLCDQRRLTCLAGCS